jgi:4-amino-4-deoxy-L-arabinose transferase-like glycosyltransferase
VSIALPFHFTEKRILALIVMAFVGLASIYAVATPPLEASDELWHTGMALHLAQTGELPVQQPGVTTPWRQEGSQPPLYYTLVAAMMRATWVPDDFEAASTPNPYAQAGVPLATGNKNLVLHPTPPETARAVLLARALGILLGAVTVVAAYATTRVIAPASTALIAAGIVAFNPMFLFISASLNNDTLVIALNSLAIWLLLRTWHDGFSTPRSLALAALVALASLAKLSALVLVPVIAVTAIFIAWRRRDLRGLVILGVSMLSFWAILAGWWYARNLVLYDELFGTTTMAAVAGPRDGPFTLATLFAESEGFRTAYWGWFGALTIVLPAVFYLVMDLVTLVAAVGLVRHARRTARDRVPILILTSIIAIGGLALIAWTALTYASQGRLLFPFVAAIAPLMAIGLANLLRRTAVAVPAGLAVVALITPFAAIAPAYTPPAPLQSLPGSANPVYARFGDTELVGYELPVRRYAPGDSVPVTLYWHVTGQSPNDLSLWLHALAQDSVVGKVDTYPGGGTLRTSTWDPGLYADTYAIPLDGAGEEPNDLRIQVGWWDTVSGEQVIATDSDGQPLESVMLDAGGFGSPRSEPLPAAATLVADARFGDVIALVGFSYAGDTLSLYWSTIGQPTADYTVFLQALNDSGQVVAQADQPPSVPTRFWLPDETFVTRHTITIPAGSTVVVGWYYPDDGRRLPTASPDDAFPLRVGQ